MRVGALPYLNAVPLLHGLPWEIRMEPPATLQASLLAGRFDLALCSVTTALCHEGFFIVPGMGIGCRGAVASVRLVLHDGQTDVRQCRRIALDPESNTANLLLRVLLRCKYDLHEVECIVPENGTDDVDAHLVIGDRAFMEDNQPHSGGEGGTRRAVPVGGASSGFAAARSTTEGFAESTTRAPEHNQPHSGGEGGTRRAVPVGGATRAPVIDLGAVWSEWTGAPFVFAAWLVRTPTITHEIVAPLLATRARNLAQLETLIARMPTIGNLSRARLDYLRHNISYALETEEVEGMQQFHAYLIALGLAPDRPLPFAKVVG